MISRLPLPLSDAGAAQFPSRFESTLADAATSLGLELYATQSRDLYTFATFHRERLAMQIPHYTTDDFELPGVPDAFQRL